MTSEKKFIPTKVLRITIRSPIYQINLSEIDPDTIAKNIRLLLDGHSKRDESNAIQRGFHITQTEILTKNTNNLFDDLIKVIENKVSEIVAEENTHYNKDFVNIKPVVENFWCLIYKKGDKSDWHYHQRIYSHQAVYYPEDVEDCSPIVFQDSTGQIEIKPKKGDLIIFSNYAMHMVPELTSEKDRLVFVSNLLYKARD